MFYFDPLYFLFAMLALPVMLYAQHKVQNTYSKYSKVRNMNGVTGLEVAHTLLRANGLTNIGIEGNLGKFDRPLRPRQEGPPAIGGFVQQPVGGGMGIVAHEAGHAVQDNTGYVPMKVKAGLAPVANLSSWPGYIFFILGIFVQAADMARRHPFQRRRRLFAGDAAGRAGCEQTGPCNMRSNALVTVTKYDAAGAVFSAAALTYVAALLQAVGNLLFFVMVAMGMSRRD